VIRRRSEFRLREAERKAHINEGLLKAINVIDEVIATIRQSDDRAAARDALMAPPFEFSEVQANHILEMPLGRLTRLARIDLETLIAELQAEIAELNLILADEVKLRQVIKDELAEVREKFADERRSKVTLDAGDMNIED